MMTRCKCYKSHTTWDEDKKTVIYMKRELQNKENTFIRLLLDLKEKNIKLTIWGNTYSKDKSSFLSNITSVLPSEVINQKEDIKDILCFYCDTLFIGKEELLKILKILEFSGNKIKDIKNYTDIVWNKRV